MPTCYRVRQEPEKTQRLTKTLPMVSMGRITCALGVGQGSAKRTTAVLHRVGAPLEVSSVSALYRLPSSGHAASMSVPGENPQRTLELKKGSNTSF